MTVHRSAGAILAAQARVVNDILLDFSPDQLTPFAKYLKVDLKDLQQAVEEERTRRRIEAEQVKFLP